MAENGILDYQGMNQAIYRGATSNIIVDTQSMSIEIGAGNSSHTSNLHIECDHDANVASIQLNSNVVAEFPRSKKLIKYPRVAMTSAQSAPATENGYTVTVSNETTNKGIGAFDGAKGANSVTLWYSGTLSHYTTSDGSAVTSGANIAPRLDTNTDYGEWISIQLPVAIKLISFHLWQQYNDHNHFPQSATIYGKKETNDQWSEIYRYDNRTRTLEPDRPEIFDGVNSDHFYKYFALVGRRRVGGTNATAGISIGEWELYGVPEYDPEAHGTDVTVKSVANVPNTDWLEVYYDAKDLADGSTTVNDLKPVGTAVNGTVAGSTTVLDGAFTFDEADDYIEFTTGKTGNYIFSVSLWFKSSGASVETLFNMNGDYVTNNTVWLYGSGTSLALDFVNNNYSCDTGITIADGNWHHASFVYNGNGQSGRDIYFDGKRLTGVVGGTNAGQNLSLTSTVSTSRIGALNHSSGIIHEFKGSIANFRLFNRALSSDEIYQLYAYQKEYFGHGDLSMTLKAGRLGIGTSEPLAALDVRGDVLIQSMISHVNGFYEEGTWTPYIAGSTSGVCYPSGSNYGWFIRVGNLVTIGGTVAWSGYSGAISGNRQIMGLPYPARNVPNARTAMSFGVTSSTGLWNGVSSGTTFRLIIDPGYDFIFIASSNETAGQWSTYNIASTTIDSTGVIYGIGGTYRI